VSTVYRYQRPHRIHEAIAQFNPYQEAIHFVSRKAINRLGILLPSQGLHIPTFGFEASIAFRYITDDHNTCIVHARRHFQLATQIFAIDLVHGVGNERTVLVESDLDSHATENIPQASLAK
jgi:GAF domain-containing protein